MRRELAMIGTLAIGMTAFAPAIRAADDQPKPGIGPIRGIQDVEDTAKLLFKLADTNNDGQISQKEATDAGNLVVGGFFFRADANGDGVLTREEAQQARDALFAQQPLLKLVFEKAKPANTAPTDKPRPAASGGDPATTSKQIAADPARTIGSLLDTNQNQKIEAAEVRQAVQSGVQAVFSVADANQDGQLTPAELNSAVGEFAKSAAQTVFQAADTDRNGELSLDEYDKALAEPAHSLFRVIDADNNNQISLAELQRTEQILADQLKRLRVPEPPNSLLNQAQNAARSSESQPRVLPSPGTATTAPR